MKSLLASHAAPRSRAMLLSALLAAGTLAAAAQPARNTYVLTSTNDPSANKVLVFKFSPGSAALPLVNTLSTGGVGGASGNAGILQFRGDSGAVANYGSNTVSRLVRAGNAFGIAGRIALAPDCTMPDSVAITDSELYVVGANCAESHTWPSGRIEGNVVPLPDASAGQIVAGKTWAAVTLKSGSVLRLPIDTHSGALSGTGTTIDLPEGANDTPLGAAFWDDLLGFTPAHSPDSFALVNTASDVYPILGPAPAFPSNAPCWVAKGPRSIWYTGNTPGQAISIFFTDAQGGVFYKSVPLPGAPTDIVVSPDKKWLAVIYSAGDGAHIGVFSIDEFGGLKSVATSAAVGVATFNGVAFSQ